SLSFLVLEALTDATKTLLSLGKGDRRAANQFTASIFQAPNNAGTIPFTLAGTCTGGGVIQGLATIYFFSCARAVFVGQALPFDGRVFPCHQAWVLPTGGVT